MSLPGLALAYFRKSARLVMPRRCAVSAFITSTLGTRSICVTGAKSFTGSYGSLLNSQGLMPCEAVVAMPRVSPSGAALATALTPMLPPAPGRFSTMTVPSAGFTASARMRAVMSIGPPAPNGTTMRVTLSVWASAGAASVAARARVRRCRRVFTVCPWQR